jgi:tellurite resistance protein TerC
MRDAEVAGAYITGFLIEKSLSLDNLFVFAVLFATLGVSGEDRYRVLVLGIALAMCLRAVFIVAGIAAIEAFDAVTYLLGALLALTALGVARHGGDQRDLSESRVMRLVRRLVPANAPVLTLPLAAVAAFDVMFAIDSIPAIFAVSTDTLVVVAANAWSLCGMVSLYFLLENALERFRYLHLGLAAILGFVAAKLLLADFWHPPIGLSLGVVVASLVVAAAASAIRPASRSAVSGAQ